MSKTAFFFASLGGIGRVRFAPGTLASLIALPLAWLILRVGGESLLLVLTIATAAIGASACDSVARALNEHDPSECVVDELVGQWLTCAFAPLSLAGFALAFVLFRLFDILKPWPVSASERLIGGLGIMADDMVAALMGGVLIAGASIAGLI